MNNLEIINSYFTIADIKKHKSKCFSLLYGNYILKTLILMKSSTINGIYEPHTVSSLDKLSFQELWEKEEEILDRTCTSKFREKHNVNIWLIRDWQLLKGYFIPRAFSFSQYKTLPEDLEDIVSILKNPKKSKILCINDSVRV